MVSVKYSLFCCRILYYVGQSALCDVIMVTKRDILAREVMETQQMS